MRPYRGSAEVSYKVCNSVRSFELIAYKVYNFIEKKKKKNGAEGRLIRKSLLGGGNFFQHKRLQSKNKY